MNSNISNTHDNYPSPHLKGYHIERRLGTGTYATVYKATLKGTNEVSAIKCIKKNGLNKTSTDNLLREIKILKQIKHDYIVQLKDFQWDENYIYLIMEYCPGGDLSAFIKSRRTIPEKYVRRFVQQIACALMHLHLKGIAHMDLKPQNILLTSTNNPSLKLADFGFAQYMRDNKQARSLRGSPLYMAPEILKCKVYDRKVDLWSVGVILYEVIFGYAPFVSNTLDELEKKILDDIPIQIPTHIMLSETCKDLLKRLLQRNPAERISFDNFFKHPFVDLDHMAASTSYPIAIELLNKAVKADEKKNYLIAQRYYLQSIEYLIPAIQYEKDVQKKQEIRQKAKIYLKRAEEIAILIKQPTDNNKQTSSVLINKSNSTNLNTHPTPQLEQQFSSLGISNILPVSYEAKNNIKIDTNKDVIRVQFESVQIPIQIQSDQSRTHINSKHQSLLKYFNGNDEVKKAISMCIKADDNEKTIENSEDLLHQYTSGMAVLFPLVKLQEIPKETQILLKSCINEWLANAEKVKELNNEHKNEIKKMISTNEGNEDDDEETNSSLNQCMIQ